MRVRDNPELVSSNGRRQTLELIFNSHHATVFGFVLARSGSREVAADVSSETFVEAARVVKLGRGAMVSEAWLVHVARLRLIDHWRKQSREQRRIGRLRQLTRIEENLVQPKGEVDPRVGAALEALTGNQRAALVLRYLDDHSVTEVADALELSYPATESLLARARRSFVRAYNESADHG